MKIRRGPAAVIGSENRSKATAAQQGGGKARQLGRTESQKTCPAKIPGAYADMREGVKQKQKTPFPRMELTKRAFFHDCLWPQVTRCECAFLPTKQGKTGGKESSGQFGFIFCLVGQVFYELRF